MADNDHTIIQDLKADERPRERLIKHGPSALRNAELLAILIGSGSTTENAVSLMERLLVDHRNSLGDVGKMTLEQLCRYKGIGEANWANGARKSTWRNAPAHNRRKTFTATSSTSFATIPLKNATCY